MQPYRHRLCGGDMITGDSVFRVSRQKHKELVAPYGHSMHLATGQQVDVADYVVDFIHVEEQPQLGACAQIGGDVGGLHESIVQHDAIKPFVECLQFYALVQVDGRHRFDDHRHEDDALVQDARVSYQL